MYTTQCIYPCGFYKSYLMTETKIIIPPDTHEKGI